MHLKNIQSIYIINIAYLYSYYCIDISESIKCMNIIAQFRTKIHFLNKEYFKIFNVIYFW